MKRKDESKMARHHKNGRHNSRSAFPRTAPNTALSAAEKRTNKKEISLSSAARLKLMLSGMKTAMDGFSNSAAFLGEASPLMASGTFHRSHLTSNPELLTTTYRESWLAKRIIDMPAQDCTRAWYTLRGSMAEEETEALRRLEARHDLRRELTDAIRWARLFGGSIALIVIRGDEDRLSEPLDTDLLLPNCFQGVLVLDRSQGVQPSLETVQDLDDPDFGLPEYYTVALDDSEKRTVRLHHSRVIRFVGRELPGLETVAESYWGASELEHIWDELIKRSATSANIAQLVFQANITTLKMADFGEILAASEDQRRNSVLEVMEAENRFRTSYGIQLLSKEDSYETHPYAFTGLSDIYESFMMDMAGASEIPATKLFGRSPQGLNATGESDLRNYYEFISEIQEHYLRPALNRLLPVMAMSCWGCVPDNLDFTFNPLSTTTPAERAELMDKLSASVIEAFKAGIISREEAAAELRKRGEEYGLWTKLGIAESSSGPRGLSEGKRISAREENLPQEAPEEKPNSREDAPVSA